MSPKILGACTRCDKNVFEVVRTDTQTRLPLELGAAHDDAMRVTFILVNGTRMDLTFCADCASTLVPAEFPHIWQRVMLSWISESGADHPAVKANVANGILGIVGMKPWKEVVRT